MHPLGRLAEIGVVFLGLFLLFSFILSNVKEDFKKKSRKEIGSQFPGIPVREDRLGASGYDKKSEIH